MTLDFESDQFLTLLTDALRAGPGSPAWHEAVNRLRQQGAEGSNEYQMLLETRQNLESGKSYREVRAGDGFTKKVMAAIDEQGDATGRKGIPTPTIVAIVAAVVGLTVVALIGLFIWSNAKTQPPTLADLQNQTFTHDLLTAAFDRTLPAGWNQIGAMKLSFEKELRPVDRQVNDKVGGGIVSAVGLPADQSVAMEVTLRPPGVNDDVIMQVFVTDDPSFSADRGTSPHELVWDLQTAVGSKNAKVLRPELVLPGDTFAATGEDILPDRDGLTVRIAISANFVIVDSDGKRLYANANHLAPDKPRYFGVRFLRNGNAWLRNFPAVEAVRIVK